MRAKSANPQQDAIASLIGWWELAGVDAAVAETPRDWLAVETVRTPPMSPVESTAKAAPAPVAPTPSIAPPAMTLPDTLDALAAWLHDPANLSALGPRRCPPSGPAGAALMLMADQPDSEDLEAGQLFAGPVGPLLDAMLKAIGHGRDTVYLASLAPGRPAAGRIDPALATSLAPIARRHVALAQSGMILLLGEASVRTLLGLGLAEARGQVHEIDLGEGRSAKAVASFHPRFLIQQPTRKADAWADLKLMMAALA